MPKATLRAYILHIEAASLDEFEEVMLDAAPELIMANHRSASEIAEH